MKKLGLPLSALAYLTSAVTTLAQDQTIQIKRPAIDNKPIGYKDLNNFISNGIQLIFIAAIIIVLVMLVWGGVEWIMSGGDKEAVGKARDRIINALIGLAILAVAFAVAQVAGQFLGINILQSLPIPTPAQ